MNVCKPSTKTYIRKSQFPQHFSIIDCADKLRSSNKFTKGEKIGNRIDFALPVFKKENNNIV